MSHVLMCQTALSGYDLSNIKYNNMQTNFFSKSLLIGTCFLCIIGFMGCPGNSFIEPYYESPVHYLTIKNKGENTDFFIGNTTYFADSVRYKINKYVQPFALIKVSNENRFEWSDWRSNDTIFIDYKNGDIDTLAEVSTPIDRYGEMPIWSEMKTLKLYFNGVLVKDFDFVANPSLKKEYSEQNCVLCGNKNPILIELPKSR